MKIEKKRLQAFTLVRDAFFRAYNDKMGKGIVSIRFGGRGQESLAAWAGGNDKGRLLYC